MTDTNLDILEIELPYPDGTSGLARVAVTLTEIANKPEIEVFTILENDGPSVTNNILRVASAVRDQYFPNLDVDEISWKMTNNWQRISMSFQEIDERVTIGNFPDGIPDGNSFISIEQLRTSLGAAEGFDQHYSASFGGHVGIAGEPTSIVSIPVPDHPNREVLMRHRDSRSELVLVDAQSFIADWRASNLQRLGAGNDYIFSSDTETAIRYMTISENGDLRYAQEVGDAVLSYRYSEEISFINGRHRTANLATLGAEFLPLSVSTDNIELFRAQYGYLERRSAPAASRIASVSETNLDGSIGVRAMDSASDLAGEVDAIKAASMTARLGGLLPAIGVVAAAGSALMTDLAIDAQRDFAQTLLDEGAITSEAYRAYLDISKTTEVLQQVDNAANLADPTGLSIFSTIGLR